MSQRGSYNYTTLLTPHWISSYTLWDFQIPWNKPFLIFSTLSVTAILYFLLTSAEVKQHLMVLQQAPKRHFHFDNVEISHINQNLLKYFDISKISILFQSFRISLYRACRNKSHSAWLCRKEEREMLEQILGLRLASHRNAHGHLTASLRRLSWSSHIHLDTASVPTVQQPTLQYFGGVEKKIADYLLSPCHHSLPFGSFSRMRKTQTGAGEQSLAKAELGCYQPSAEP